ncbi:hypothetical protein [Acidovorax sp.]|uniref:hypothetical protein n=1 Tax=Acidovorax sp. TaxID=1872122 RepID=UPI002ACEAF99|nr:hypothetical protein [Acidovorax sp.]MDZ7863398.1 hypothetical protein [Acidovorax sp.]
MKRLLLSLALCAPMLASAATISLSCIGPVSDDCPMAADVTLDREALYIEFSVPKAGGGFELGTLGWCGVGSQDWGPGKECYQQGTYRVLNGELTKRQLGQNHVYFKTRKVLAGCGYPLGVPQCN